MISLDTKRFLRKKKFWIGFASVLMSALLIFLNLRSSETQEYRSLSSQAMDYKMNVENNMEYMFHEGNAYVDEMLRLADEFGTSVKQQDWNKINHNLTNIYLLETQRISALYKERNTALYFREYITHTDKIDNLINERELPVFSTDTIKVDWKFMGRQHDETQMYPYYQFQARFYDQLEKQDIDQLTYSSIDSSTVFIQFIRLMFPLLPAILVALMCYDSLQEDRDSGVVKVILSQPRKRSRYMRNKIGLNIKAVLFIFLVPLLVLSLGYGIFDHYHTAQAPVLANVQGITSMDMMENSLPEIVKEGGYVGTIGTTQYFAIPYNSQSPNAMFDFMEMWQFVILILVMSVLVLIFLVLFDMLINVLIRNKIMALAIALGVFLVGMFLSDPSNVDRIYGFSPFTFLNPVSILSGFSTYTYLNGIVILVLSNILLYILIMQIYKRNDVVC